MIFNPGETLAPLKSNSSIYVGSSVNQLFLNLLNPYHHFSWSKVTINVEWPVFNNVPSEENDYRGSGMSKEEYDNLTYYDMNNFTQSWGIAWKELLESKDSILYPMFIDLVNEAKTYIRYSFVNDVFKWRKLVGLYIAHHLELFVEILKDIHNDRSMNVRVTDENEHRKITVAKEVWTDYKSTIYGRLFIKEYDIAVKWVNPLRGLI